MPDSIDYRTVVPITIAVGALGSFFLMRQMKRRRDATINSVLPPLKNMSEHVVIVTGANTGLGLELCVRLAALQSTVVLACRSSEKAEAARRIIIDRVAQEATGLPSNSEHVIKKVNPDKLKFILELDLLSIQSINRFAEKFNSEFDRLDVLVNNAGIMAYPTHELNESGVEMHMAANHLGAFHLTNQLLPKMASTNHSRIVNVSSGFYTKVKHMDNYYEHMLEAKPAAKYDPFQAYARSKLANCLHVKELSKRLQSNGISVFACRPGFVRGTDLGRYFPKYKLILGAPFIWFFSRNLSQGVQSMFYCSISDLSDLKPGALYSPDCELEPYTDLVTDHNARELWEKSMQLVNQ